MTNTESSRQDAIDEQAESWLIRLRSGSASPEDAAAFRHWCEQDPRHREAAQLLGRMWGNLAPALREAAPARGAAAQSGRRLAAGGRAQMGRRLFVGGAVAAAAGWLALRPPLALWPSVADLAADYRTGTGEQRKLTLAHDVVVDLNTRTRVDLLSSAAPAAGIRLLAGEADIQTDISGTPGAAARPFDVVAASGRVRAWRAGFNVRLSGDAGCVTCVTGTVELRHPHGRATLSAGQQVVYDDRAVHAPSNVDTASVTAWRRGVLVFDDVPLAAVIDEINRYRPGKLVLRNPQLGDARVQAQFSLRRLDDAIVMVRDVFGAHVTTLPGGIVLLS
ncbi:DUF4880 domain-containing protein [Burkholderia sp. Bp8963]|uniref:FecR family protein n=1 Tax=Burkholderia sp. Bp8963 TaxID=2184547 RepID=UPI000F5900BB|nr:DUF4880 domain-containing protein [Burkholderia sp. Bp8963]RQS65155.1 DUF4880 domain-containing protein [Burkholderia sp. Bp8963]